jgi:hypothetical protein
VVRIVARSSYIVSGQDGEGGDTSLPERRTRSMQANPRGEIKLRRYSEIKDCLRSVSFGFAPGTKIYGVKSDAEYICRNEAELRGPKTNHTDYGAIDGRQDPALPATLAQQDGRHNRKNAG